VAREITDSTFISAVKYTYKEKGRAVTSNEVVAELLRRRKEKPSWFARRIINFEAANTLDELYRKRKIRQIIKNRTVYYMPL
jgi:hypothetical protein